MEPSTSADSIDRILGVKALHHPSISVLKGNLLHMLDTKLAHLVGQDALVHIVAYYFDALRYDVR